MAASTINYAVALHWLLVSDKDLCFRGHSEVFILPVFH